jgi:drug/metabolite transporter (DMT)-like permease
LEPEAMTKPHSSLSKNNKKGIQMMLISVLFFAAMNLIIKYLPHLPATELVLFRAIVTLIMSFSMLTYRGISPWGGNKRWLIIRGLAGTIALTMYFYTVQNMPLSAAITLQYLSPFFTAFIAGYLLKEKTQSAQWGFFLVSFLGIAMLKWSSEVIPADLLLIGVGSSMLSGLAYNAVRKLKDENPLVIVMYFSLIAFPIMLVFALFNWVPPTGWDWALLLGLGVSTQYAQLYMTKSYHLAEVSTVAPLKYLGVIFAIAWDITLFDFMPSGMMFIAIGLVIAGVVLNLWYQSCQKVNT